MQEQQLYDYAVIRYVPDVAREEFINVGVIIFSKRQRYLKVRYQIDQEKIQTLAPDTDFDLLHEHLEAFVKVCAGTRNGGPIAALDTAERFRWLTAVRSAAIQTSRPHPGFSADLDATLEQLFREMVA